MNTNPNFVFFGTDEFATTILEELKASDLVPGLIVTTPDTLKGRKLELTPPAVKLWAERNGVEFIQPANLKTPDDKLLRHPVSDATDQGSTLRTPQGRTLNSWEFFLVASYGKIIPQTILDLPKHGTLNIHPSLLPKHRGAAPLQSAILNGDTETGVTIMLLDAEMDHGPILDVRKLDLGIKNFNFVELREELALRGAHLLTNILPDYLSGKLKPVEQNHAAATYTKKITKDLGQLNLADSPELNDRKIRALNPNPGSYFIDDNNKRVKVISAHLSEFRDTEAELLQKKSVKRELGNLVSKLVIDRVVPEGKKEMDWESYKRGLTK